MTTQTGAAAAPTTAIGSAAAGAEVKPDAGAATGAVAASTSDAKPDAAAEKVASEKAAAELAGKPFTDVAQLKLPENFKPDAEAMKALAELGVNAGQAQKLLELNAKMSSAAEAARTAAHETAQKAAVEALKADKEIGGANFEKSMALAGKALRNVLGEDFAKWATELELADGTMLCDRVEFARALVNLGKKVSEDSLGSSSSNGKTAANDAGALQRALYTHPTSKSLKFD